MNIIRVASVPTFTEDSKAILTSLIRPPKANPYRAEHSRNIPTTS